MALQIDWKLFVSTSVLIFVAELPDKTAFATLMLMGEHWCCCFVYSIRVSDVAEKGPRRGNFHLETQKSNFRELSGVLSLLFSLPSGAILHN
jgi:hypothetical protein